MAICGFRRPFDGIILSESGTVESMGILFYKPNRAAFSRKSSIRDDALTDGKLINSA
ncbi:hypothetical protein EDC14_1013129 [Hydrogenispora ethanolica]|uniref:Uncharacterized protein n=1 Tax=Hydrogenispora ethanolica TaxID=1082276 RepID=A0A4V2QEL9_HYDET|nr:hypothetical protein EDC14_1013129 [Hydrogenispora ethanolica]